jgi:hypothetical protein
MSPQKSLLDRALDVMVFAPLELAADQGAELSQLAERGRRRVEPQMAMARVVGRLAFGQLQREVERQMTETAARVRLLFGGGSAPPADEELARRPAVLEADSADRDGGSLHTISGGPPDTEHPRGHAGSASTHETTPAHRRRSTAGRPRAGHPRDEAPPTAASSDLAIHGYDALSAPQVVQRLAGLSSEELEAVRVYETATRGRRTILARIAQLQAGSSG